MHLDSRKEHILDFIVRDFIRSAQPVSSGRISENLHKKQSLAGSPATIRNIMLELDEEGYLHQPHTSAGRAPTEKGYRYFVDNLMEIEEPDLETRRALDEIIENFEDEADSVFDELSRTLASHLGLFSGIGFLDEDRIFGHGLAETLREPEFSSHKLTVKFAGFVENIESNIKKFGDTEVDADGFGMVRAIFRDGELGECVIFSAGPQRMNYEKANSVIRYAAKDIVKKRKNKKPK